MSYPLQTIFDRIPAIVYISDNTTQAIQWCNKYFEKETGYTLAEMKDMGGLEFFRVIMHPDDFPKVLEAHAHLKAGGREFACACRIRSKYDQEWRWFYGTATSFSYDAGEVKEIICSLKKLKILDAPRQMHLAFNFMIKKELHNLMIKLTRREKEVLDLLFQGKENYKIAGQLFISIDTLKTHKAHIREKLGADNLSLLIDLSNFCNKILD